jgi:hypothetical protein
VASYNSDRATINVKDLRGSFKVDEVERLFYNPDDPNDFLTDEEFAEASKVLEQKKIYMQEEENHPIDFVEQPKRFKYSFWAMNINNPAELGTRGEYWKEHLQWSRRTQFAEKLPQDMVQHLKAGNLLIQQEFTLLKPDHLAPSMQCINVEADSEAIVR